MPRAHRPLLVVAALVSALSACGKKDASSGGEPAAAPKTAAPAAYTPEASNWSDARADFVSVSGEKIGGIEFHDGLGGVLIRVNVAGLTPGWHGIHLHMVGDCSDGADGFKLSGGHINPDGTDHGLLNPAGSHRADIPNLRADDAGEARGEFFRAGVNLKPSEEGAALNGPFPLIDDDGFAIIIHESPDDHITQPIGGAGARVACAAVK